MSTTYINLGTSCNALDINVGKPADKTLSNIFILNASTGTPFISNTFVVKSSAAGFTAFNSSSHRSNNVVLSTFSFDVWFSESLLRSGVSRENWRLLTSNSVTNTSVPGYISPTNDNITISTTSGWPTQTQVNSLGAGTTGYPAIHVASTGSSVSIVNGSNTQVLNAVSNFVQYPTSPSIPDNATKFYLQDSSTPTTYLRYASSTFSRIDTNDQTLVYPLADFEFYLAKESYTSPQIGVRLILTQTSGATSGSLSGSLVTYSQANGYRVIVGANTYNLTLTSPTLGPRAVNFPSSASLLRSVDRGKYLYWNGTKGDFTTSILSLRDYWSSLTPTQIKQGMQFWFMDLTTGAITNNSEINRWMIVNNPSSAPDAAGNTSNITVSGSTLKVGNGANPQNSEGWVLSNTSSPYWLQYVTLSGGSVSNVGYIQSVSGQDNIQFVPSTGPPPLNNQTTWQCFKCSPVTIASGGDGYCSIVSSSTVGTIGLTSGLTIGTVTKLNNTSVTLTITVDFIDPSSILYLVSLFDVTQYIWAINYVSVNGSTYITRTSLLNGITINFNFIVGNQYEIKLIRNDDSQIATISFQIESLTSTPIIVV